MKSQMKLIFEKFALEGEELIQLLSKELKTPVKESENILINVLHSLRGHLTMEENIHFLSGLPLIIKALYVDGWQYFPFEKRTRSAEEFVVAVMKADRASLHNFPNWSVGVDMIR